MSESDTMFNERDQKSAAVQLMLATDSSYDKRTIASTLKMQIWIATNNRDVSMVMKSFQLRLWSLVWFQVRATSCHLTSLKSPWKSTPKCMQLGLTPFLMLRQKIGNLAFLEVSNGNRPLKRELSTWPLRTMWCEEIFLRIGKFLMVDWEPEGVLSGIPYLLLNLLVEKRYF